MPRVEHLHRDAQQLVPTVVNGGDIVGVGGKVGPQIAGEKVRAKIAGEGVAVVQQNGDGAGAVAGGVKDAPGQSKILQRHLLGRDDVFGLIAGETKEAAQPLPGPGHTLE